MKLCTTTGDFKPLGNDEHIERLRHVAAAGFKHIDLSFYDIDKENSPFMRHDWRLYADKLKAVADELGVTFVQSHLPNCNPLDTDRFDQYVNCTKRCIEAGAYLGIDNAVIHVGWKKGISKEEFFALNKAALTPLFATMEKYRVNVLIENSCRSNMGKSYYFYTGADMKEFLDYVSHPFLFACWDTGHANVEGHQYEDILALGDSLKGIHFNDNNGIGDEHIAPFRGTLNVDEVLTALIEIGYKGYLTFEAGCTASYGDTWQLKRHPFAKDTRLFNPTLAIYDAATRYLYEIGKACLTAYNIFEE